MLDTATITSTMAKNYSHCPLKKRPIQFLEDDEAKSTLCTPDSSVIEAARKKICIPTPPPVKIEIKMEDEPENLCTKPQDLSKRARINTNYENKVPNGISSFVTSVITSYPPKVESPQEASSPEVTVIASAPSVPRLTSSSTGGAFHRVITSSHVPAPRRNSPEPIHYAPTTWHRSVAPHYPPAYFPTFGTVGSYPSPYSNSSASSTSSTSPTEIYHPYPIYPASPPSPYAPRDSSCSPPTMVLPRQPLAPIALLPDHYSRRTPIIDRASLSPASSSGTCVSSLRSHSPINEPADLSPPSNVTVLSLASVTSNTDQQQRSRISSNTANASRHQCPDCGKSYSTFSGLSKHRQFHCAASGDGPRKSFSCKYCEKVYVSLGALKMHIRTHTLPCKCTLCGKAFSRPWLLQGHIRTHTGEKPFSCQHCHRAFADRSNLRAHLQTHSEVKKYSCPTCSKTFSRMSLLTKHAEGGGCNGSNPSSNGSSTNNLYPAMHPQKHTIIDMHHHSMY